MRRYGVRPSVRSSVRLSHSPALAACGGFAAVDPVGRRYRSIAAVAACSATLSAYVGN